MQRCKTKKQTNKQTSYFEETTRPYRVSQKIVPRSHGCCGGAVDSIISIFAQLHRPSFNLEFETLYEFICQVVADLWQREGNNVVTLETALLLLSSNATK